MQLIVFEDDGYRDLLPLVYARPTFRLRCGFDSLLDKIEAAVGQTANVMMVRPALAPLMQERHQRAANTVPQENGQLWVNGRLLLRRMPEIPGGTCLWIGETPALMRLDADTAGHLPITVLLDRQALAKIAGSLRRADFPPDAGILIRYPWDLVAANADEISRQFQRFAGQGGVGRIDPGAHLLNASNVFLSAGARVKPGAVLDAESGPIFVGEKSVISPNATLVGPCYIGEGCTIRPGALVVQSSIGPICKIGGEVEGTIIHALSNKQHDGFLGHSYVGEWVNLGADTVNSDLKNTYGNVRVPLNGREIDSGQMFVGAFIGDHAKTGIRVALPTGCVIGYACNVFVSQYSPKFLPSFSWLTDEGLTRHDPIRAAATAGKVMARRNRTLTPAEESLFLSIAESAVTMESQPPP